MTKKIYLSLPIAILSLLIIWKINYAFVSAQNGWVNLIWSCSSYTPPMYYGKALPVPGSQVEVIADVKLPGFNLKDLTFEWSLDGERYPAFDKKQYFKFVVDKPPYSYHLVNLEILDKNKKTISLKFLHIPVVKPQVILADISNGRPKIINGGVKIFSPKTLKFKALPYFFNISSIYELNYFWKLDEQTAQTLNPKNPQILQLTVSQSRETIKKTLHLFISNKFNLEENQWATTNIIYTPNIASK